MTDKDIEVRTAIAKALYTRQQERCDGHTPRYILPPWDSLPDDSKGYWMRDAEAVEAALKSLGWLSPADATAMAQAAQRDAVWKAAQHLRANFQDPIVDMAASAIVALTPSSGPWQRVPEGSVVVPNEPTLEMLKAGAIAFYDSKQDVLAARLPEAYRAMLAEVKK